HITSRLSLHDALPIYPHNGFFKNLFSLNSANPLQRKFLQLIIQSTLLHNIANNHLQEVCNMGERTEFRTGDKEPNNSVYIEFGVTGSNVQDPEQIELQAGDTFPETTKPKRIWKNKRDLSRQHPQIR